MTYFLWWNTKKDGGKSQWYLILVWTPFTFIVWTKTGLQMANFFKNHFKQGFPNWSL